MWQKCPICNGTGKVSEPLSNNTSTTCTVCQGKKIISELTGLPPAGYPS
jgi:DnaJ-class molecular chaperone